MMTDLNTYPSLDRSDELILEIDEDGEITRLIQGDYPAEDTLFSDDLPYRGEVICRDQHGNKIRVSTDMDSESLYVDEIIKD